jgi:hypothetical protein
MAALIADDGRVGARDTRSGACLRTLRSDRVDITGLTGATAAQLAALLALGAVDRQAHTFHRDSDGPR